jgi:hypothetical protein
MGLVRQLARLRGRDPYRRHPADLRPVGWIQRWRGRAYPRSQRGRADAGR